MRNYKKLFEEQYKKEIDKYERSKRIRKMLNLIKDFLIALCVMYVVIMTYASIKDQEPLHLGAYTKILTTFELMFSFIVGSIIITFCLFLLNKKTRYRTHYLEKYAVQFATTVYADDIISFVEKITTEKLPETFKKKLITILKQYEWYHKGFDPEHLDIGKSMQKETFIINKREYYFYGFDGHSIYVCDTVTGKKGIYAIDS